MEWDFLVEKGENHYIFQYIGLLQYAFSPNFLFWVHLYILFFFVPFHLFSLSQYHLEELHKVVGGWLGSGAELVILVLFRY